tara:strand:+ start:97 stop:288 length:192 start_codon:yes stop_codon:yes gene_type:complete
MSAQGDTWTKKTIASVVEWVDALGNRWEAAFITEEGQNRFTEQDGVEVVSIAYRENPHAYTWE